MTQPSTGAAPPADDFIPAPDGSGNSAPADVPAATTGDLGNIGDMSPIEINAGLGQTEIILSLVAVIALAGLLFVLKGVIRKSLITGRATMDTANAAAWTWYLTLLAFGALVIVGIAGGLFGNFTYMIFTAGALLVGIMVSMLMTSRARRSA